MPRPNSGFTTITISEEFYERLKETMKRENEKAGYKKWRSVSHFVEHLIMDYDTEVKKTPKKEAQK